MLCCSEFLCTIEKIVRKSVRGNYPRDWDEDFITRSLLKSLRTTFGGQTRIHFDNPFLLPPLIVPFPRRLSVIDGYELQVEWDAYKMTGAGENKFGDVAILVAIRYPDGDKIEGVAFLEAKKRYKNGSNFRAVDFQQLKRINARAPRASVLLYDFRPSYGHWWRTYAVIAPMDLVIATQKKDTSLYKFSTPFSVRILRHLLGFCLEHADEPLRIAKGYQTEYDAPLYLLVLRVGMGVQPPSGDEVEFSAGRFTRFEE